MPPSRQPRPAPLTPELLTTLLEAAVHDEGPGPRLLRLRDGELGWCVLPDGTHPLDALVGFTAPDDWLGVGIVARGRMHHVDDATAPVKVVTGHLVERRGMWASHWTPLDGGRGHTMNGAAADVSSIAGRIDDACRRVLGLATTPPPADTAGLWASMWLDAIVTVGATAGGRGRLRRWAGVARLHPAAGTDDSAPEPSPEELATGAIERAASQPWPLLRQACAGGWWPASSVTPEEAAWLDDGAFARWVLGAYPELADLEAAATAVVPPAVAEAIERTLAFSGVSMQ